MNKIIIVATLVVTIIFSAATCAAADVWVDRWQSEGVEVYVMDDRLLATITEIIFQSQRRW